MVKTSKIVDMAAVHREKQALDVIKRAKRKLKQSLAKDKGIASSGRKTIAARCAYTTHPYSAGMKSLFYATDEWRKLRWRVLSLSNGKCVMCGRNSGHGIVLHVDHIKPRSKYPALELEIDNLQVLCEDCNLGKGASI